MDSRTQNNEEILKSLSVSTKFDIFVHCKLKVDRVLVNGDLIRGSKVLHYVLNVLASDIACPRDRIAFDVKFLFLAS